MAASGADKMGYRCGSARQRRLPPHSRAATLYLQPPYRSQSAQGGTKRRRNEFSHAASANYFSNARANQPRARIIVGWQPDPRHRSDGKLDRQNLARRTLRSINRRPRHRAGFGICPARAWPFLPPLAKKPPPTKSCAACRRHVKST